MNAIFQGKIKCSFFAIFRVHIMVVFKPYISELYNIKKISPYLKRRSSQQAMDLSVDSYWVILVQFCVACLHVMSSFADDSVSWHIEP